MAPRNVIASNERSVWWYSYWPRKGEHCHIKPHFKLEVGDNVRVSVLKRTFDQEYDKKWSGEIFQINSRFVRDGLSLYKLRDFLGEDIKGTFYESELSLVNVDKDQIWKVSKVLIQCKRKGKNKEYYVRWLHWPKKFDSWVLERDIKCL